MGRGFRQGTPHGTPAVPPTRSLQISEPPGEREKRKAELAACGLESDSDDDVYETSVELLAPLVPNGHKTQDIPLAAPDSPINNSPESACHKARESDCAVLASHQVSYTTVAEPGANSREPALLDSRGLDSADIGSHEVLNFPADPLVHDSQEPAHVGFRESRSTSVNSHEVSQPPVRELAFPGNDSTVSACFRAEASSSAVLNGHKSQQHPAGEGERGMSSGVSASLEVSVSKLARLNSHENSQTPAGAPSASLQHPLNSARRAARGCNVPVHNLPEVCNGTKQQLPHPCDGTKAYPDAQGGEEEDDYVDMVDVTALHALGPLPAVGDESADVVCRSALHILPPPAIGPAVADQHHAETAGAPFAEWGSAQPRPAEPAAIIAPPTPPQPHMLLPRPLSVAAAELAPARNTRSTPTVAPPIGRGRALSAAAIHDAGGITADHCAAVPPSTSSGPAEEQLAVRPCRPKMTATAALRLRQSLQNSAGFRWGTPAESRGRRGSRPPERFATLHAAHGGKAGDTSGARASDSPRPVWAQGGRAEAEESSNLSGRIMSRAEMGRLGGLAKARKWREARSPSHDSGSSGCGARGARLRRSSRSSGDSGGGHRDAAKVGADDLLAGKGERGGGRSGGSTRAPMILRRRTHGNRSGEARPSGVSPRNLLLKVKEESVSDESDEDWRPSRGRRGGGNSPEARKGAMERKILRSKVPGPEAPPGGYWSPAASQRKRTLVAWYASSPSPKRVRRRGSGSESSRTGRDRADGGGRPGLGKQRVRAAPTASLKREGCEAVGGKSAAAVDEKAVLTALPDTGKARRVPEESGVSLPAKRPARARPPRAEALRATALPSSAMMLGGKPGAKRKPELALKKDTAVSSASEPGVTRPKRCRGNAGGGMRAGEGDGGALVAGLPGAVSTEEREREVVKAWRRFRMLPTFDRTAKAWPPATDAGPPLLLSSLLATSAGTSQGAKTAGPASGRVLRILRRHVLGFLGMDSLLLLTQCSAGMEPLVRWNLYRASMREHWLLGAREGLESGHAQPGVLETGGPHPGGLEPGDARPEVTQFRQQDFLPRKLLRYLDPALLADGGLRLARLTRADCRRLGDSGLKEVMRSAMLHKVFLVAEGVFDPLTVDMEEWLDRNQKLHVETSGNDVGVVTLTLKKYSEIVSPHGPQKPLPTFNIKAGRHQAQTVEWLERHGVLGDMLPWTGGGCPPEIEHDTSQYGPFTFGGDMDRRATNCHSRSTPRHWLGGSTIHLDGMGSFGAAGGLRAGIKEITSVEAEDAVYAMRLACQNSDGRLLMPEQYAKRFMNYAKPGGSLYAVNEPLTPANCKDAWRENGVKFGTFRIKAGDFYLVPAGVPHEFLNRAPCLSVAWNFMPEPGTAAAALAHIQYTIDTAVRDFRKAPSRVKDLVEHAPQAALVERLLAHPVQYGLT